MAVETRTGGREATSGVIGGGTALAVGDPGTAGPPGFAWTELLSVARLETGHTPSRRHPEYWGGDIPWIGIKDATANYGRTIYSTNQTVTEEGIANSSARVLPAGTVCLSRTASVGYVVVMGVPMATSQDFVNWVCGPDLDRRYLKYVLQLERETLLRFASGTTHQTIYFPEAKAFHVLLPEIGEQRSIADVLGALDDKIESNRRLSEAIASVIEAEYLAATARAGFVPANHWLDVDMGSPFAGDCFEQPGVGRPLIRIRDLKTFEPQVWTSEHREDEKVVQPGDVLVGMDAEFRSTVWLSVPGVLNQRVCRFAPRTGVARAFALHAIRADLAFYEQAKSGTTVIHLNKSDIEHFTVPDLSAEAHLQFAEITEPLVDRWVLAALESRSLAALRNALLPELLSGRLRVPAAEGLLETLS